MTARKIVSERALRQRINRRLVAKGQRLDRAVVGSGMGEWILVAGPAPAADRSNWRERTPVRSHVDIVKLGRKLGCLLPHEVVE